MRKFNWLTHGLAGLLGAAGAFAVVAWIRDGVLPTGSARAPAIVTAAAPEPPPVIAMSPDELRALLREELVRHDAVAQVPARGDSPEIAPPSSVSVAHAERAQSLVEGGAARRRWTDDDARALRAEMGTLTQDQLADLLRRFAIAVNEGGMKIETAGSPF